MDRGQHQKRGGLVLPCVILFCGLLATALGTYLVAENLHSKSRQRFIEGVAQIEEIIRTRLEAYIGLLRGGAGLFAANSYVTLDQFQKFYDRLEVEKRYPGLQGLGYSVRFPASKLNEIVTMAHQQGITNFNVWPPNPRDEYHAIVFLEPHTRCCTTQVRQYATFIRNLGLLQVSLKHKIGIRHILPDLFKYAFDVLHHRFISDHFCIKIFA